MTIKSLLDAVDFLIANECDTIPLYRLSEIIQSVQKSSMEELLEWHTSLLSDYHKTTSTYVTIEIIDIYLKESINQIQ